MGYTALYRKFRPETFDQVKGQDHVVITLRNQILSNRIGHAYLFCGSRGTGKTSVAKIFARAVNCEHPLADGSPCGECSCCRAIAEGSSLNVIEIDAASNNSVDNVRQIREEVSYSPTQGKYKVYIIDEVHMLSQGAFNALLKTLEEPPSYVIFILATTEVHKIPVTVLSRCQRYDFHRLSQEEIALRLQDLLEREGVAAQKQAVSYIARLADGGMRDALSLADQCISFFLGQELTYERVLDVLGTVDEEELSRFFRELQSKDLKAAFSHLDDMLYRGRDIDQLVRDYIWYQRNLLMVKTADQPEELMDVSPSHLPLLYEEAGMIREEELMRSLRIFSDLSGRMRFASDKRTLLEMAMIRVTRPQTQTDLSAVLERVRQLEKQVAEGVVVQNAVQGTSGPAAAAAEEEENVFASVPPAAPADLQEISRAWKGIARGVSSKFLQNLLPEAGLKFDPGDEAGNLLVISFPDFRGERYVKNSADAQKLSGELEQLIAQKTGKHARIMFTLANEEQKGNYRTIQVEEKIKDHIHMDIAIEDIPD